MKHAMQTLAHSLALLALLAPLGACGWGDEPTEEEPVGDGTSNEHDGSAISEPAEFCDLLAQAVCFKVTNCFTSEEREERGMAATEEECLDRALSTCTPGTACPEGSTYRPSLAGECIVEVESLTCEDFSGDPGLGEPESACAQMCE